MVERAGLGSGPFETGSPRYPRAALSGAWLTRRLPLFLGCDTPVDTSLGWRDTVDGTPLEQQARRDMAYYTASKSRNQGRESWSVIFRHPVRLDPGTGKEGRRVRRGLGTSDEAEATKLVDQLNELLRTPALWEPSARQLAEGRFDPRVVEIFYEGTEAAQLDFTAIRDAVLPMPGAELGYRRVLLLGTTGAGKTTVVRQLLGTDPSTERFPSTSTAKTTVADTELIVTETGPYRAVVTFVPRDQVVDYLAENVAEAALAIFKQRSEGEVTRRLLDHVSQRFRFSYVLGRPNTEGEEDEDDVVDQGDTQAYDEVDEPSAPELDMEATADLIRRCVSALREAVETHAAEVRSTLTEEDGDERVAEEYIEENLDTEIRQSEQFHRVVDDLSDEIERRFSTLTVGEIRKNRQGWPVSWSWSSEDRAAFIRTVARFSSNYAPLFGQLLTPLVNGIRVAGSFAPTWSIETRRLVLVDGEGLGHTPNSAAALSTHVAEQLEEVDSVLLVDSATQPMQAAPVAALKAIAVSGNAPKLTYLFTHFDQVSGDNLPTFSAREEHVLASVENVLKAIGEELGPLAERGLRQRLDAHRYFVGGIQDLLDPKKKAPGRTIDQLERLLEDLVAVRQAAEAGPSRPVFDRLNLSLAVSEAAKSFHAKWRGLLGIQPSPTVPKEHWTRVKALSRRLAEGWDDEYDTLKPVADLRYQLQAQVSLMLQRPLRWENGEPDDDAKQAMFDAIANAVTRRLFQLTRQRLADDVRIAWQDAYAQRGAGSTYVRARIIANDVYERGAPVPSVAASPDQNRFLRAVADVVEEVADELDLLLE